MIYPTMGLNFRLSLILLDFTGEGIKTKSFNQYTSHYVTDSMFKD